jgi:hypothetical protein
MQQQKPNRDGGLSVICPKNPMRSYQLAQELSHTFEAMLALLQKEMQMDDRQKCFRRLK